LSAPISVDSATAGMTSRKELAKYGLRPVACTPILAVAQAAIQGSMVQSDGSASRLAPRISASGLNEFTSIT